MKLPILLPFLRKIVPLFPRVQDVHFTSNITNAQMSNVQSSQTIWQQRITARLPSRGLSSGLVRSPFFTTVLVIPIQFENSVSALSHILRLAARWGSMYRDETSMVGDGRGILGQAISCILLKSTLPSSIPLKLGEAIKSKWRDALTSTDAVTFWSNKCLFLRKKWNNWVKNNRIDFIEFLPQWGGSTEIQMGTQ